MEELKLLDRLKERLDPDSKRAMDPKRIEARNAPGRPHSHREMEARQKKHGTAETTRDPRLSGMPTISEDLAHGQFVIVSARWVLVLSALVFTFWNPGSLRELRILTPIILLVAVGNFYLHAQLLKRRPTVDPVVYAASIADLAVISLIIYVQGGFESDIHIFYFPAFLGFSVAFPTIMTLLFAVSAMVSYALITLGSMPLAEGDLQTIAARLVMLAAVAACGNLYWRIESGRRRAAMQAREELMAQMRGTQAVS